MNQYAPFVRIVLRYLIGAGVMGSEQIGDALAQNPDIVAAGCVIFALAVESIYALAKRRGWAT